MDIQTEIERINNAKEGIAEAISEKGVTVTEGTSIDDYPALVRSIPQEGGSDCNSVMISGVVDLSTMRVASMSHTYAEIKAMLEAKKMIFVETYYGFGYAYGQITSDNLQNNNLFFQVMLQNDFGDGTKLYYLAVRVSSSDNITLTPYIINTTAMGG